MGTVVERPERNIAANESGQVIVEYILMLFTALVIIGILANGFRTALRGIWDSVNCEVTAACPACPHIQTLSGARCRH
jgi:Flp pilus assembly pilin Flp